jgi:hypothetical protein
MVTNPNDLHYALIPQKPEKCKFNHFQNNNICQINDIKYHHSYKIGLFWIQKRLKNRQGMVNDPHKVTLIVLNRRLA